jgi:hypothetical protein
MKVKELIEMLEKMGVEKELRVGCVLESGRSVSGCRDGEVWVENGMKLKMNEEGEMEEVVDEDGDGVVEDGVVLLMVGGEEDYYE